MPHRTEIVEAEVLWILADDLNRMKSVRFLAYSIVIKSTKFIELSKLMSLLIHVELRVSSV